LASPGHEEISERRPTLTAPARDSVWKLGRNEETGFKSNKETEVKKKVHVVIQGFWMPAMIALSCADAAGVRKAPRHEIAVGSAVAVRRGAMGTGRGFLFEEV
jgi:hypothetical protein